MHPIQSIDFEQIQVQMQIRPLNAENIVAYQTAESERIHERIRTSEEMALRKAVVIVDASCNLIPESEVRQLQAAWMKQHADLFRMIVHATAFVVPSSLIRGTLTAVMWMAPMPFEVSMHSTLEQALAMREALGR